MQGKKPRESNDERRVSAVSKNKQLMHKTLTMTSKYNYLFPHSPTPLFFYSYYYSDTRLRVLCCRFSLVLFLTLLNRSSCHCWHQNHVLRPQHQTLILFTTEMNKSLFRTLHLRVWRDWRIVSVCIRLDQ